jgi:hypothetical protein
MPKPHRQRLPAPRLQRDTPSRCLAVACLWLALSATAPTRAAEPTTTPAVRAAGAAADPLDATAPVPRLQHESAFTAHRRWGAVLALPWREANDEVARICGWRADARESQAAEAARQRSPADAASAPTRDPRAGHKAAP